MSANLLDGITPQLLNGTTESDGIWHHASRTSASGGDDWLYYDLAGQPALYENQTFHFGLSTMGASADSDSIYVAINYRDASGHTRVAWSAPLPVGTSWGRAEGTIVVPSGMTPFCFYVSAWYVCPETWMASPTLCYGSTGIVIASDQITLTDLTDVSASTTYYLAQTSTLTAPSKPTVKSPTGWTTTEPTVDTSKSLYVSTRTDWSNGEFTWSDVSLSSSYEAAKAAYNKAVSAQTTATTAYSRASYCYGTCDTANTVYAKVATLTNFPSLYTGATCAIKFTYGSSKPGFITDKTDSSYEAPTTLTLNVNGTGAKEIHSYSVAITNEPTDYSWIDGAILNLIYDGTSWVIVESSLLSKIISTNNEVSKRVSSSQLQQTADNITASFGTSIKNISNNLNTTNIGLQDATNRIDTINSMVQIGADETTGTPYLFLGKQGSDFSVTLTNSELDFTDQGVVVASMSNQELHILTAIISSTIGVGNWRWMTRANNHLSLTYGSDS